MCMNEFGNDYFWLSGNGRIELQLNEYIVDCCWHIGDCEEDVRRCMELTEIREQLNAIDPELLKIEMEEYCDWDCTDHETNLMRLLWIAAGDIRDKRQ